MHPFFKTSTLAVTSPSSPMATPEPHPPVAVSVAGVARLLGISERAVYALRKCPNFPRARLLSPRAPRFLVTEIVQWASAQPGVNAHQEPAHLTRGRVFKSGKEVNVGRA
jgi:predicted DNA-binding transcriptional regulator AlpA